MCENKEIEVTPEMVEAGYQVLYSSGIADEYLGADKLLVDRIYRAMYRLSAQRAQNSPCETAQPIEMRNRTSG
jgi:hypothetical protein